VFEKLTTAFAKAASTNLGLLFAFELFGLILCLK
jgi:hypothetical protein